MEINLRNSVDFEKAMQLLEISDFKVTPITEESQILDKVTVEVGRDYYYTCPYCDYFRCEDPDVFIENYNKETGTINCYMCDKELNLKFDFETELIYAPELQAMPVVSEDTFQIQIEDEQDYQRVIEFLKLGGVSVEEEVKVKEAKAGVDYHYRYECPNCDEYLYYQGNELSEFYDAKGSQIWCEHCGEVCQAIFVHEKQMS